MPAEQTGLDPEQTKSLASWMRYMVKPAAPSMQLKTVGRGVQWVGNPDFRSIIRMDQGGVEPDADELTRGIALATSAYCYTAVMYRASKFSEPPLYIAQEQTEGGEVSLPNHDLVTLLDEPSPDFEMSELLALTEAYMLTTGACLWVKMRDTAGRVSRLQPFSGDEVRTESKDGRIYGKFKVLVSGGGWKDYLPEDVVWLRDINPNSWRSNLSKVDVALSQLDLGHQVNRTVRNFMRKAMFPGGIVSPDKDWDPEDDEWNAFKNTIEGWYGGPAAAGIPLVLQGGATFSRAAIPLKELLPTELLDRIEAVVGSVFGIAPVVMGWKVGLENSPWSQMSEARQSVYEETIIPRWNTTSRKLDRQMLSLDDRAAQIKIRFDLTDVAALRADDQARATVAQTMVDTWTRDERRAYTGQEPLGDDDPRGNEIGASGGGGLISLGQTSLGQMSEMESNFLAMYRGEAKQAGNIEWAMFDVSTKAAESTWARAVEALLKDQERQILGLASRHLRQEKSVDKDSIIEFVQALAEWMRKKGEKELSAGLFPLIHSTGAAGVKRAAAQIGLSFQVLEPGLLTYAKEEADFLASVMSETTGRKVAKIVQDRLSAGGLIADIRKDLQTSAAFSRGRAQLVARTETTRAWNGAQRRSLSEYERAQDETVRVTKSWLSSRDDRVRDEHADMDDGTKYRIDELYPNGLMEPGEPNCRCTQTFDLEIIGQ